MAEKRPNRARIDGILGQIELGAYDDKLVELQNALDSRREALKEALNAQIQAIYGPGHYVATARNNPVPDHIVRKEPVLGGPNGPIEAMREEAPIPLSDPKEGEDGDIESRSPQISG